MPPTWTFVLFCFKTSITSESMNGKKGRGDWLKYFGILRHKNYLTSPWRWCSCVSTRRSKIIFIIYYFFFFFVTSIRYRYDIIPGRLLNGIFIQVWLRVGRYRRGYLRIHTAAVNDRIPKTVRRRRTGPKDVALAGHRATTTTKVHIPGTRTPARRVSVHRMYARVIVVVVLLRL